MTGPAMRTYPVLMADIFKALRGRWMTRPALAGELDISDQTVTRWVAELEAQGMLKARPGKHTGRPGPPANEYTLAPEWGGTP